MNWAPIIDDFKGRRVLVAGDICLDRWCRYDPAAGEPSRETGLPRIGVVRTEVTPGAGGTVAVNLASLGAGQVAVLGAMGRDGFGFELKRSLAASHIDHRFLVASPRIQTFTYTKVINVENGDEDQPRLDFINNEPLPGEVQDQLMANFHACCQDFDVIVVADQAETDQGGVVGDAFREMIAAFAERHPEKILVVDSRHRIERFRNAIAKPNVDEAEAASRRLFGTVDLPRLRDTIGRRPLVVTRGAKGALLIDDRGQKGIPAAAVPDPVDLCGAGDSFAAGMALVLGSGGDVETAIRFGVLVSSVTIMKKGTGFADPAEILARAGAEAG